MTTREGVAGAGFQIALEFVGGLFVGKGNVGDEAPRFELRSVRRLTGIVLGQALFQIRCDADIAPLGTACADQHVNVVHSCRLGARIARGVRISDP
jgi:hypothetical protein